MSGVDDRAAAFGKIVLEGMEEVERAEVGLPAGLSVSEWSLSFEVPGRGNWIVVVKRPGGDDD